MGIELDWQVDDAPEQPSAPEVGSEPPKRRRWWPTLLIVLVTMIATVIGARWRLDEVDRGRRELLENTIYAELLAIRLADQNKFMQAQGPDEEWRQAQREMFAGLQVYGSRFRFPEQSQDIQIEGSEARVTVEIEIDGQPREFEWVYEYDLERGWRHVATSEPLWGTETAILPTFEVEYNSVDEDYVLLLAAKIQQWWDMTCSALRRCPADEPIDVLRVIPGTGESILVEEGGRIILIVATTSGNPDNGGVETRIRETLTARWIAQALGDVQTSESWPVDELHTWLRHQLDPDVPSSDILDPLVEAFQDTAIPADFANRIRNGTHAIPALREVIASRSREDLTEEALKAHLTGLLRAGIGLRRHAGGSAYYDVFIAAPGDHPNQSWDADLYLSRLDEMLPEGLRVVRLIPYEDIVFAEVEYDSLRVLTPSPDQPSHAYFSYSFQDGLWLHRPPTLHWEQQGELAGELVRITYFDFDLPYMDGLLEYAEDIYRRAAEDFGYTDQLFMYVFIEPNAINRGATGVGDPRPVNSVYWSCCLPGQTPEDYLRQQVARAVIWTLLSRRSGVAAAGSPVEMAIVAREMERLNVPHSSAQSVPPPGTGYVPPDSLIEMWDTIEFNADPYGAYIRQIAVDALLEVLIEQHDGQWVLGPLAENLDKSSDLERWLRYSLGDDPAALEDAWRERFHARLAAVGIGQ